MLIGLTQQSDKFRFIGKFERYGHCEKVAHTGVAIPRIFKHFSSKIRKIPEIFGDCHTSDIGHWFAMTG